MAILQELSGNPNPQYFSEVSPVQMEAYCGTNRRHTVVQIGGVLRHFPFSPKLRSQRGTALQMGGELRYKLEMYRQYFSDTLDGLGVPKQSPILPLFYRAFFENNPKSSWRLLYWVHCIGSFENSCEFWWHSLGKQAAIHHNSGVSAFYANYDGFLLVFPSNVIRIRMNSRNSLYNAPSTEVFNLQRKT